MLRSISTRSFCRFARIEALKTALAALLVLAALASPAQAARVSVIVVPPFDPATYAGRGAVGLFVPGSGDTVSRAGAVASLVRGKVEPAVLGGTPSGTPKISLATRPAPVTIYVALPPPGKHANTKRYPIAVVGGGYHGILTSRSTRIRGLVSIADVAPTATAIAAGKRPVIRSQPDARAVAHLEELDRRMTRTHDARLWATLILVCSVLGGAVIAFGTGSRYVGRAGLMMAPAVVAASLFLSAVGVTRVPAVVALLAGLTLASAFVVAAVPRALPWVLALVVVAYLVVLSAWPEVNSLAALGARPDGGGRFYGIANVTETVLLTISLEATAFLGRRAIVPMLLLTLVTIGWSHAGADGGGIVVVLTAFGVLAARMYRVRPTPGRIAAAAVGVVLLVAALVGLDAATGGSSHVTHAFRTGPVSLVEELGHRIHISAASIGSGWHQAIVFGVSIAALVILGTRPPRFPAGDALLAGIAVSLLVNDSPSDVAAAGAVSYAVMWAYERVREPVKPRTALSSSETLSSTHR